MDGDIGGAWFVWTFREAVAATGAHRSATQAAAFYQRMADEINAACARGALACRSERHSLTPILQRRHWVPFLATLWPAARHLMASPMHSSGGLMVAMGKPEALAVAQDFVHQPLAASRAEVPAAQPVEAVITVYQWLVPPASALAAMAWVLATPWPRRVVTPAQAGLWCLGALLLVLVMSRLVLLALIHVSSWPPALEVRYLAPAQPLWLCWVGIGWVLLGWQLKSKVSRSLP